MSSRSRGNRRGNSSSRHCHHRFSRRHPWYAPERWRPRASERDRVFWVGLDYNDDTGRLPRTKPFEETDEVQPVVSEVEKESKLHVMGINLHIEENAEAHHTDRYECIKERIRESDGSKHKAELVIRRGQEFKMTIKFNRYYDFKKNDIRLTFKLGDDYKPNKNLNATFKVDETGNTKYKPTKWGATVVDKNDESWTLTLNVFVPASAPIGEWEFSVRTIVDVKDGKDLIWQYIHNEDINLIFNPWCREDWVYMEDEAWRDEAVLNDTGVQYTGNRWWIGVKSWNFGQFEDGILDAALHLVRKCFKFRDAQAMSNAAEVARLISKIVNSQDDDGVLAGNWSGNYEGGSSPTKWNGSVKILRQYMATTKPVRYGQCWVFSAVTTAVCRALGMPCRSVTNYASAHNADKDSLSIDAWEKKNEDGEWYTRKVDSVWNFHVWNEVWMARPDLSEKGEWDGWQVIDATPQETSDGVFCCGPAPVKAIKEGEITIGRDGHFIFAEVKADRVKWKEDVVTGKMFQKERTRNTVGKNISTHMPTGRAYRGSSGGSTESNNLERLDLTNAYKYEAGCEKDREITRKAERKFKLMHTGYTVDSDDDEEEGSPEPLEIEIEKPGDTCVGSSAEYTVHVKNVTSADIAIKNVTLKVFYKTYFDSYTGLAASKKFDLITLKSNAKKTYKIQLDEKMSTARPQDSFNFELIASTAMKDCDGVCCKELNFRLRRPDLNLKGPETCGLFDKIKVDVSFTNPLSVKLTECEIDMEGGFKFEKDSFKIPDIAPGKTWKQTLELRPKLFPPKQNDRELSISFESKQLKDIMGIYAVELKN